MEGPHWSPPLQQMEQKGGCSGSGCAAVTAGNNQTCSPGWMPKYITKQKKLDMFLIEICCLAPLPVSLNNVMLKRKKMGYDLMRGDLSEVSC